MFSFQLNARNNLPADLGLTKSAVPAAWQQREQIPYSIFHPMPVMLPAKSQGGPRVRSQGIFLSIPRGHPIRMHLMQQSQISLRATLQHLCTLLLPVTVQLARCYGSRACRLDAGHGGYRRLRHLR